MGGGLRDFIKLVCRVLTLLLLITLVVGVLGIINSYLRAEVCHVFTDRDVNYVRKGERVKSMLGKQRKEFTC